MNLKLELIEINSDVIATSGLTATPYCAHFSEPGFTSHSRKFMGTYFTDINGYDITNLSKSYYVFDVNGKQTNGLEIGKWYHTDIDGNYHECSDTENAKGHHLFAY